MTTQPYLVWQERYSVGNKALDAQHKSMFVLLNELYDAFQDGQSTEAAAAMFHEAQRYAFTHFKTEELLLEQAAYPQLSEHKAKHRQYESDIERIKEQAERDGEYDSAALFLYLKDWWLNHILMNDQQYAPFLASPGESTPSGDAGQSA
jgi:hemerythrin-like metal-binding protein